MKLLLIILATLGVPLLVDPHYYWPVYLVGVLILVWHVDREPVHPCQRARVHAFD